MRVRSLAVLAIVALVAVAVAPTFAADTAKDLIVGKWQPGEKAGESATLEFTKDGKVKVMVMAGDKFNLDGTYKFVKDNQIEVTLSFGGKENTVKLNVKVTKDELTTTEEGKDKTETFKRIK